jgi:ketosteroid isomerase-like protein
MKRLFTFASLLIAVGLISCSQTPNSETPQYSVAQQELITLSEQWNDALARKDTATLERILAEEYYISPPGELNKTVRSVWLKNAQEMDWRDLRFHNFKVDIYGDTAVVTSLLDFKVTTKRGIPIITNAQVIDVWVKRDGRWQVAARHLGAYSLGGYVRLAAGFAAGLVFCFLIWLLLRFKRRFTGKRKMAES